MKCVGSLVRHGFFENKTSELSRGPSPHTTPPEMNRPHFFVKHRKVYNKFFVKNYITLTHQVDWREKFAKRSLHETIVAQNDRCENFFAPNVWSSSHLIAFDLDSQKNSRAPTHETTSENNVIKTKFIYSYNFIHDWQISTLWFG
jgi:hypothetical protein